jgi:DNA-binding NtrC family response regulator
MSSSGLRNTTAEVDETADKTHSVEVLTLVIAYSADEPERVGEVGFLSISDPPRDWMILGRGDVELDKFVQHARQRPGEPFAPSVHVRPEGELFASTRISRRQALVRLDSTGTTIDVDNIGALEMRMNGKETTRGEVVTLHHGDWITFGKQLILLAVKRPKTIPGPPPDFEFGEPDRFGIVGESPQTWALRAALKWAAGHERHVLLRGESGTGKELAAAAIHRQSRRSRGPFAAQNVSKPTDTLVEAVFFGKIANFPNPGPAVKGLFAEGHGGTVFLDEIGNCPRDVQRSLLRTLDKGEFRPLGADSVRFSNARVIGATNKDDSHFEHDLLPRFKDVVELTPLRERREDVPLLVRHTLRERYEDPKTKPMVERFFFQGVDGKPHPRMHVHFIEYFLGQPLLKNTREIDLILEKCLQASPQDTVRLPASLENAVPPPPKAAPTPPRSAQVDKAQVPPRSTERPSAHASPESGAPPKAPKEEIPSKEAVLASLKSANDNVARAARALGVERTKFYRILRDYGIKGGAEDSA